MLWWLELIEAYANMNTEKRDNLSFGDENKIADNPSATEASQAILETSRRQFLVDTIKPVVEQKYAKGLIVLGSMAWGREYSVSPKSDLDLQLVFSEEQLEEFSLQTVGKDFGNNGQGELADLVENNTGDVLRTIDYLSRNGFAIGDSHQERRADLLNKFTIFTRLHAIKQSKIEDLTDYEWGQEPLTESLADYIACYSKVGGIDV
jgi:predicted nucleotidyltransferase